jgi:hypothetical protein
LCPEDGEGPFLVLRRPFMFVVEKEKEKENNKIQFMD